MIIYIYILMTIMNGLTKSKEPYISCDSVRDEMFCGMTRKHIGVFQTWSKSGRFHVHVTKPWSQNLGFGGILMRIVNGLDCIPIFGDGHHSSFVEIYVPIYPFCFDSHEIDG
jgi:hypothetical protein